MNRYMLYSHAHNAYVSDAYYDHDGVFTISFTTKHNKAKKCTCRRDAEMAARTIDSTINGMDLDIMGEYEVESKTMIFKERPYTSHPGCQNMTDIYERYDNLKKSYNKLEHCNESLQNELILLRERYDNLESENDKLKRIITKIRKEVEDEL